MTGQDRDIFKNDDVKIRFTFMYGITQSSVNKGCFVARCCHYYFTLEKTKSLRFLAAVDRAISEQTLP